MKAAVLCLALCAAGAGPARTDGTPDTARLAVDRCLRQLRACQLPDGAFAQVSPQGRPGAPVWIVPYFSHFAALALLAHVEAGGPAYDRTRAGRWLDWCAAHQNVAGYWNDFEGTFSDYRDTGRVDAWDSSAALFLLAADRFRQAGGALAAAHLESARRAVACLAGLTDPADGLTWAKPDHRVKYLMDNIEVRAGLLAAGRLFAAAGREAEARDVRERAERLGRSLATFWRPERQRYSWARLSGGTHAEEIGKPYPEGLAQLYGLAFIEPRAMCWEAVCRDFTPETGPTVSFGAEWWLMAATRMGDEPKRLWRTRAAEAAAALTERTYLHRHALSVLALLQGASWLAPQAAPAGQPIKGT
jgi:hypothetical protein